MRSYDPVCGLASIWLLCPVILLIHLALVLFRFALVCPSKLPWLTSISQKTHISVLYTRFLMMNSISKLNTVWSWFILAIYSVMSLSTSWCWSRSIGGKNWSKVFEAKDVSQFWFPTCHGWARKLSQLDSLNCQEYCSCVQSSQGPCTRCKVFT